MHYLNQFFAGMGGEDKADLPVSYRAGPLGPGRRLQALLGESAAITTTVYCGDNYFAEHTDEALASILKIAKEQDFKLAVAGPAFGAGRYGFACVEVCRSLSSSSGMPALMGMHTGNPAVELYKRLKDLRIFILPTSDSTTGMEDALSKMAAFTGKLASGARTGSASDEGYIPRGIRLEEVASKNGMERGIDMLVRRLAGEPFATEIPIQKLEEIPVTPPLTGLKEACIALISTSGVTVAGNPYKFKMARTSLWKKYPIDKLNSMKDAKWETVHGGYNTVYMNSNPNFGVPLDACRELEKEHVFGRFYPYFYGTTGNVGLAREMENIGRQIAQDMKREGVDGVLLVST